MAAAGATHSVISLPLQINSSSSLSEAEARAVPVLPRPSLEDLEEEEQGMGTSETQLLAEEVVDLLCNLSARIQIL